MVFPLMALGAGLGQGMQQIQQQQLQQEQLKQLLQARQVEELLGSVARSGGQIPGFGGLNLPGTQMQQLPGTQQQPMMPPRSPIPAGQTAQGASQAPAGMMKTETDQIVPQAAEQDTGPRLENDVLPLDSPDGPAGTPIPLDAEPGGAAAASAVPGQEAAAPQQQSYDISSPNEFSQYLGMFHAADPSAIAKHISAIRPDADNGAVWRATATLMKMTSGSMREQLAAASMMKFLMGEQRKTTQGNTRLEQGQQRLDQGAAAEGRRAEQGNRRLDQGDKRIAQTAARDAATKEWRAMKEAGTQSRFEQRMLDKVTARASSADKKAIDTMATRHRLLRSQIDAIDNSVEATKPEAKSKRAQIFREMQDLESRIDKRVQALEQATPVAE